MRRRSRAGGEPVKARRRKTTVRKRGIAPKAARVRGSAIPRQETEVARLTRERDEALEQLAAASHVLRVVGSSARDLRSVFEVILENATRICEANFGNLWLARDDGFLIAAWHGLPPKYREQVRLGDIVHPGPAVPVARAAKTRATVHIRDLREDRAYRGGEPVAVAGVELGGVRTLVAVPLLKENKVVGACPPVHR